MCGSSTVTKKGTPFSLLDPDDERSWHERWKAKVAAAVLSIEKALAALARSAGAPPLRRYDRALPLVSARERDPAPKPCRYRVELPVFGIAWVDVALDAPPDAAQRAALRKAIRGVHLENWSSPRPRPRLASSRYRRPRPRPSACSTSGRTSSTSSGAHTSRIAAIG